MLKQFRNYIVRDAGSAKKKCLEVDAQTVRPEFNNPLYSDDDDDCEEDSSDTDTGGGGAAPNDEFQSEDVDMAQEKVAFDGQKLETAGLSINQASSSSAPIEKDRNKGTPIG